MGETVDLDEIDAAAVERLLDRAFGPERHRRTAYRLRAGAAALPGLSLGVLDGDALIGSIQCWPVTFAGDDGGHARLTLVGPVAIAPEWQGVGLGRRLVAASLDAARNAGLDRALMLIGDPGYYGRFFGFSAAATAGWRLPGPVERHRLLARGDDVPARAGTIGPRLREPG